MKPVVPILIFLLLTLSCFASLDDRIADFSRNAVMIRGSSISTTEWLLDKYYSEQFEEIKGMQKYPDLNVPNNQKIILLGGPSQNAISAKLINEVNKETITLPAGYIVFVNSSGKEYMIISDFAGFSNLVRVKSPLDGLIPRQFIPLAIAFGAFSILWIWHFFSDVAKDAAKKVFTSKIIDKFKKKSIKPQFLGFHLAGIRIKLREWISIFLASFTISLAIAYIFAKNNLITLVLLNLTINSLMILIKTLLRLYFDKRSGTHTEYIFWPFGAIITLVSGWLGQCFGLAGYTVSEGEKNRHLEFVICIVFFVLGVAFFIRNVISPSVILQMAYLTFLTNSYVDMLPFEPFAGAHIKKSAKGLWLLAFIPMTLLFGIIMLFLT